jgi:hypothetical protein
VANVGARHEEHRRGDEHPPQDSLRLRGGRASHRRRGAKDLAQVRHRGRGPDGRRAGRRYRRFARSALRRRRSSSSTARREC